MKKLLITLGLSFLLSTVFAQSTHQMKAPKQEKVIKQTAAQYTCPMHPDVKSNKPGKCPKCKMGLVKKETKAAMKSQIKSEIYICPMHPDITSKKPGKCSKCGMNLEKKMISKAEMKSEIKAEMYTCPMHLEEKSNKPGKCAKCGMNLEKINKAN